MIEFILAVVFTWSAAAWVCCGLGSLLLRLLRVPAQPLGLGERFWVGLTAAIFFALVWNDLWPLTATAPAVLSVLGAVGWLLDYRSCRALLTPLLADRAATGWFAVFVLLTALASAGRYIPYDTGLYGAATVQWATSYPAIPGIANLHGRLAFNSSNFLCLALLDHGYWKDRCHHLFLSLLIVALAAWSVPAMVRVIRAPRSASDSDRFEAMLLLALFPYLLVSLSSMDTDIPATLTALAAAAVVVRWTGSNGQSAESKNSRLAVALLMLATLVTIKLSALIFSVVLSGFLLAMILRANQIAGAAGRRAVLTSVAFVILLAGAWFIRGTILSGYPLYPGTIIKAPVDWRATRSAAFDYQWVRSWARSPFTPIEQTRGLHWIHGWVIRAVHDRQSVVLPIAIFFLVVVIWALNAVRKPSTTSLEIRRVAIALFAAAGVGLVFWFVMAPDPRFAGFDIWIVVGTTGMFALASLANRSPFATRASLLFAIGLEAAAMLNPFFLQSRSTDPAAKIPTGAVHPFGCRSGLVVWVPTGGDQAWIAPLPGTPYPDPDLRLRVPGDLSRGFVTRQN